MTNDPIAVNRLDPLRPNNTTDGVVDNKDYGLLQRYLNGWDVEPT